MIPFTPRIYYNVETGEQGQSWQPGTVALLQKEIKMGPEQEGPPAAGCTHRRAFTPRRRP